MADREYDAAALAGVAQEALMQIRINSARFLGRPDARLIETNVQWQRDFERATADLVQRLQNPTRRQGVQSAQTLMKTFETAFAEVATQSFAVDRQVGETMARLAESVATSIAQISAGQQKSLEEIDVQTTRLMETTIRTTSGLSIGALVLGLLIAWFLGGGIAGPVVRMTEAMKKLAGGDKTVEIPAQGRTDEIGQMAGTVQVFKDNMIEAERLRGEQEEAKRRAEVEKKAAMNGMADDFESSVKGIVQMVLSASTELQSTAQSMTATAEETSRQASAVAAASEQASTNVQTVASAAEELSSSIAEISRQVAESAKISGQAVSDAERTNQQVNALAEAAQRIGDVVKLINGIAGQTNLLALNATIEAARAGEAGKGFAVVASEVKSLANQTAKATDEISAQVTSIQTATSDSVQAIQSITGTIGRINEIAAAIASAVEEQGAATQEIARNVQQAAAGTNEVSSNITGVTKAATDTGAAAGQVLSASGELSRQSEALGEKVDAFISRIRAS
ncbi:MAG: HAMP domain-containing protein [Rhodospirillales bacterium]|nr:HAMP domain-containing protein [Rhodospirillales bacterium]